MLKRPFTTKEKLEEIARDIPTPFHIYDEKGIRENIRDIYKAFSWNPGFREYFAVKAEPNPVILKLLKEEGCGCDCSSLTELMMSKAIGCGGELTMFSSNDTPDEEYVYANDMGAIINLDDFTMIESFAKAVGKFPKTMCCRYNPGGIFKVSNGIMDSPGDAKYGMTTSQLYDAFKILKENGVENFGIHSFLVSNAVTNDYYPMLAKLLFELAVEVQRETGCHITFINLSGGGFSHTDPDPRQSVKLFKKLFTLCLGKLFGVKNSRQFLDVGRQYHRRRNYGTRQRTAAGLIDPRDPRKTLRPKLPLREEEFIVLSQDSILPRHIMSRQSRLLRAKLFNAGSFANFVAEVVELGAANHTATDNLDAGDTGTVDRENPFNTLTSLNPANGESFFNAAAATGNDRTLEVLDTLGVTFDDFDSDFNGITDIELVIGFCLCVTDVVNYVHFLPLLLLSSAIRYFSHKSGRLSRVTFSASSFRNSATLP